MVFAKLHVTDRAAAVARARDRGYGLNEDRRTWRASKLLDRRGNAQLRSFTHEGSGFPVRRQCEVMRSMTAMHLIPKAPETPDRPQTR
jgi:hypothetical protein